MSIVIFFSEGRSFIWISDTRCSKYKTDSIKLCLYWP